MADFREARPEGRKMMTYERFEQLPVWQAAIGLGRQVYALTANPAFRRQCSLRDQLERAAVSASNNIAEGFERGTTRELLTFLYIARGSAGEVRSMLCLLETLPGFENLKSEIPNLKSKRKASPGNCGPGPIPCKTRKSPASAISLKRPARQPVPAKSANNFWMSFAGFGSHRPAKPALWFKENRGERPYSGYFRAASTAERPEWSARHRFWRRRGTHFATRRCGRSDCVASADFLYAGGAGWPG